MSLSIGDTITCANKYDLTDIPHDCRDCKHNDKQWYEMPCDACCPAHCGFEIKEKIMKRYIDAEDVEKRIDIVMGSEPKAWDKKALKELKMYVVHAVPTADVRENVKGEWVEEYDDDAAIFFKRRWVCSACGDYQTYGKPKFCPNCGADMRGEQNG